MRTIYIDDEFKCHTSDDGTMTAVETDFFDGKCDTYVEGHRLVPSGDGWTGQNGTVYPGEMIVAWKDYAALYTAQREYEKQLIAEYESLINELYSEVAEE